MTAIGITTIVTAHELDRYEASKYVMIAILPILSSWVATVLAFYFAKDNLSAATQSITDLSREARRVQLPSVRVADKMIGFDRIVALPANLRQATTKITDVAMFFSQRNVGRLPVFDDKRILQLLIDRGTVDCYVRERMAVSGAKMEDLTYGDFIAKYKEDLTRFGFVAQGASLADAKTRMASIDHCNDVFVTQSGDKAEPVLGWITDNIIIETEHS